MKKNLFFAVLLLAMISTNSFSQSWYLNQVIIGSGGNFSDPDDYATVASYDPATGITAVFDTIYTQSLQDVFVKDGKAWVAAQDSIVLYDLDSYSRIASIGAEGVNKLKVTGDILIASFWYPVTSGFVKTYSANELIELHVFNDVSDEAAGIQIMQEERHTIVAIPGSWMSTTGKYAWIDLEDNEVSGEYDFQSDGVGINYFIHFDYPIPTNAAVTVTTCVYTTFNLNLFDDVGNHLGNYNFTGVMNGFTGMLGNTLYAKINGGIGKLDLESLELNSDLIVEQGLLSMAGSCLDTIGLQIYVASTDYFSIGEGTIYNMVGESIGGFEAGVSPESLALDYRNSSSVIETENLELSIYPNPASELIHITTNMDFYKLIVSDLSGRIIIKKSIYAKQEALDISFLE